MIGRSALLSDSLPWTSDKTGRNACGPVAIRVSDDNNAVPNHALRQWVQGTIHNPTDNFEGAFLSRLDQAFLSRAMNCVVQPNGLLQIELQCR